MFHELNPSGLSLASQRLKELRQKRSESAVANALGTGVELSFSLVEGKIERLDFTLGADLAQDDFYFAFFEAYRALFVKKSIWQLAALGFREWESYWRDLNHLPLFGAQEEARAMELYQTTLNLFLSEIWREQWPLELAAGAEYPSEASWTSRLRWMSACVLHFFGPGTRLAQWPASASEKSPMDLIVLQKSALQLPREVFSSLENFWRQRIPAIKALKLVAEHELER